MRLTPAQRRTLTWLSLGAGLALTLWLLAPVLTPFVVAAVLAYVLHPTVERLAARRLPRVLAVLLVEVAALLLGLALLLLLVPVLVKEIPLLKAQLPLLLDRLDQTLAPWLAQFGIQVAFDVASIKAWLAGLLDANMEDWLSAALSSARIGGSMLLALFGNAGAGAGGAVLPAQDWPQLVTRRRCVLVPPRLRASFRVPRRMRSGPWPVPARAVAGDGCAGGLLQLRWRWPASTWRCRWACSPAWRSSFPTWVSAWG
jgi:hypothetical protein